MALEYGYQVSINDISSSVTCPSIHRTLSSSSEPVSRLMVIAARATRQGLLDVGWSNTLTPINNMLEDGILPDTIVDYL